MPTTLSQPRVAFVEVEETDREFLSRHCPAHWQVQILPLTAISVLEKIQHIDILSVAVHSRVDKNLLVALPNVRLVATRSTGYDHLDLEHCHHHAITVCNVPDYANSTVAEYAFALILALSRKIVTAQRRTSQNDFSASSLRGIDLAGKTLGIIGTGKIGRCVARLGHGFDMSILAYDPSPDLTLCQQYQVSYVTRDELLASSDIISLHCPLSPTTYHFLGQREFELMKRGVILINTARGDIVDCHALLWALNHAIVGYAGLDVLAAESYFFTQETSFTDDAVVACNRALLAHNNVIITPHIAYNSQEAINRLFLATIANIEGFLTGRQFSQISWSSRVQ